MPNKHVIPIGTRYGRLTVIDSTRLKENKNKLLCQCDCGIVKQVSQ